MNIGFVFINLGPYHFARLKGAEIVCKQNQINLFVIQLSDHTFEHPWGDFNNKLDSQVITLLSKKDIKNKSLRNCPYSTVARQLEKLNPDILFIPGWSFDISKKCMKWSKKNNVKCVLMSESKYDDKKRFSIVELYKKLFIIPNFHAALVGGEDHLLYLYKLGMDKKKIFKGYDAVDNQYFFNKASYVRDNKQEFIDKFPNLPKNNFFLSVTRLIPRKNIKNLIYAYKDYININKEKSWDLVICGSGKEFSKLLQLGKDLMIDHKIHLLGFVPYESISIFYGLADCFIHPAIDEQWGLVMNEACAAALPVLSSKTVGASKDLSKENLNGFNFDPLDICSITNALCKMSELSIIQRKDMSENSIKLVDKLSPENFGKSVLNITNSI